MSDHSFRPAAQGGFSDPDDPFCIYCGIRRSEHPADRIPAREAGTLSDPYAGDCGCGHSPTEHPNGGPCAGTGATLDPIYGIPTDQACACIAYAEAT
jgi:hypothetical protein